MGTINFRESDVITLASADYFGDLYNDVYQRQCIEEEAQEAGIDFDIYFNEMIEDLIYEDYQTAYDIVGSWYGCLGYFNLKLIGDYYDGFQLMIERNFPDEINDMEELNDIKADIHNLSTVLEKLVKDAHMIECFPGWNLKYNSFIGTLIDIDEAFINLREEAENIPLFIDEPITA